KQTVQTVCFCSLRDCRSPVGGGGYKRAMPSPRAGTLRRIFTLARPEWRSIAAGTAFLALGSAMGLLYPQGLRVILDSVLGGIGFLLYTSPLLTGLMLLVVPAGAVSAVVYGRKIRKLSRDYQDALAEAGEVAEEALSGVRTVRAFAAESAEARRYNAKVER